jgi:hypothetical protein
MHAGLVRNDASRRSDGQARTRDFESATQALTTESLRARIVSVALLQWERWNRGQLKETDPRAIPILRDYWKTGVGWSVSDTQLGDAAWQNAHPWSSAFISWVMRAAGAGASFQYASAHRIYVGAAKRNRQTNSLANPFWAYPASEVAPQVGDIVCQWRNSPTTYENVDDGTARATHGDIVVKSAAGQITAVGGNLSQSVSAHQLSTDARGFLDVARSPKVFAIVHLRNTQAGGTASTPVQKPADTVLNVEDAVRKNRFYAQSLVWARRISEIEQILGFTNLSPDERSLAETVARWQAGRGLSADGVIGPTTWQALQSLLRAPTVAHRPQASGPTTRYDIRRLQPKWSRPEKKGHWLEGGIYIRGTMKIVIAPGTSDPGDIIMAAIAAVETSTYDDMNLYDRGILTWGITQWTLHADSLQSQFRKMKAERAALFKRLFQDRGVDVGTREMEIFLNGTLCRTQEEIRLAIKGDRKARAKDDYTPWTEAMFQRMERWAKLFCDAARDADCQAYQRLLAVRQYQTDILKANIDTWTRETGYGRVPRYADGNLLLQAMLCGLYVNNPVGSMKALARTIDHFRRENGGQTDPGRWASGWQKRMGQKYIEFGASVGSSRGLTEWPRRLGMQKKAYDNVVGSRTLRGFVL